MRDPLTILMIHVGQTLPDSMQQRKELLQAMADMMKPEHPARTNVLAQIAAIETAETLQNELPLRFKTETGRGNGDGQ